MALFYRLPKFVRWLTQNREEAEDLVQETYAKTLRGFSSLQPGTDGHAWIYRILGSTFSLSAPARIGIFVIQKDGTPSTVGSVAGFPPTLGSNRRWIGDE